MFFFLSTSLLLQDGLLHKNAFDPLAQHRDWCPWITVGKENVEPGAIPVSDGVTALHQQGWKAALDLIVPMRKNSNAAGGSPAQASLTLQKKASVTLLCSSYLNSI